MPELSIWKILCRAKSDFTLRKLSARNILSVRSYRSRFIIRYNNSVRTKKSYNLSKRIFLHRRDSGAVALSCRNLLCRRKLGASAMPGGRVQHAGGAGAMLAVSGGIFVQPGRGSGLCTGNVLRDGGAV